MLVPQMAGHTYRGMTMTMNTKGQSKVQRHSRSSLAERKPQVPHLWREELLLDGKAAVLAGADGPTGLALGALQLPNNDPKDIHICKTAACSFRIHNTEGSDTLLHMVSEQRV